MPLIVGAAPVTGAPLDLPVAGQSYAFVYTSRINGQPTDLPTGGQVLSLTLTRAGQTPFVVPGPAVRTAVGTYTFPSVVLPVAGDWLAATVFTLAAGGPQHLDNDDPVRIYDYDGSYSGLLLCTVAEAKLEINKTAVVDDAELLTYVQAVVAPIEEMCGAILPRLVTESHYPNGATIVLNEERVISLTSVTGYAGTSGTTYTAAANPSLGGSSTYQANLKAGLIRLSQGYWPEQVDVAYTAGLSPIPPAINLAARKMAADMWSSQQGGNGLPDVFDEGNGTAEDGLPSSDLMTQALRLLQPYRRAPRVA